jgi:hypothetical protein
MRLSNKNIGKFLFVILLILSLPLHASSPVWTLTPLTQTNWTLTLDSNVTVQYRVTNQSKIPHVLVMQAIPNVDQNTTSGFCSNSFELAYHQSCILNLQIHGAALSGNINGGPVVCESPGGLSCYQPPLANQLSITLEKKVGFTVGNSPLSMVAGGAAEAITITNNSSVTATNLSANLTGTALVGNVTQDASNCISLAPGQTCALRFTPNAAVTLTSFPITGNNIGTLTGQIQISAASIANISVTGSPLTLQATTGTPVPANLTIINQSSTVTATNISANITATALATAGVVENSSNCNTLSPLQSCHLTFTPSTQAATNTNVTIQGTNTSATSANISVNGPPQATIAITAGSPLALTPSGSTGTMTITNNSPTETALNIVSNFTSTALNGLVTESGNTCSSVVHGASCTLTYTPGATTVSQTSFPIQGTNTSSVNGAISIAVPIHIIFYTTSLYNGNMGGFSGADAHCNADSAKPTTGFAAGYTYKAILFGNNATVTGTKYYRPDGVTLIATATGGNLVQYAALTNAISGAGGAAWTGQNDNCTGWTTSTSSVFGYTGQANSTSTSWWEVSDVICSQTHQLYCASQ